jgi:hypothetical protein
VKRKMSDAAPEFQQLVATHLETLTKSLIPVLQKLIRCPYPPEVHHLDFEVFWDSFTEGFPIRVFFMDERNCEYFVYKNGKPEYPTDVDPALLKIDYVYPMSLEDEVRERHPEMDCMTEAGKVIVPWFAKCWWAAGGQTFSLPAYIGFHDEQARLDLATQKWIARNNA